MSSKVDRTPVQMPELPKHVKIREVGPRDGLQNEVALAPADRAELIRALVAAGCRFVEAVSFVSERAVPAMAGAADVLAAVSDLDEVSFTALVPNLRGAEAALAARVSELTVTISASAAYNEKNVRMTVDQSLGEIGRICAAAEGGPSVDAVISCSFGSPFLGENLTPSTVAELADRARSAGCARVTLADTTGVATPRKVGEVVEAVEGQGFAVEELGLHLHDTRGTALLNAYAALQHGVSRFDTSVGGLGGSPFAPGAGGNLATEDLVAILADLRIETGIDLDVLLRATDLVAGLLGHDVPSRTASASRNARGQY